MYGRQVTPVGSLGSRPLSPGDSICAGTYCCGSLGSHTRIPIGGNHERRFELDHSGAGKKQAKGRNRLDPGDLTQQPRPQRGEDIDVVCVRTPKASVFRASRSWSHAFSSLSDRATSRNAAPSRTAQSLSTCPQARGRRMAMLVEQLALRS